MLITPFDNFGAGALEEGLTGAVLLLAFVMSLESDFAEGGRGVPGFQNVAIGRNVFAEPL